MSCIFGTALIGRAAQLHRLHNGVHVTYYRLALQTRDKDLLFLYVPLDDEGKYDDAAPKPHLIKTVLASNQEVYYGEIDGRGTILWSSVDYESASDIFAAPVRLGRRVRVKSYYDEHTAADFELVALAKL